MATRTRPMVLGPDHSFDAYASQTEAGMGVVKAVIVTLLRNHGPLTDEQLVDRFEAYAWLHQSVPSVAASSIRTRRHELEIAGVVRALDEVGRTKRGSACKVWSLA